MFVESALLKLKKKIVSKNQEIKKKIEILEKCLKHLTQCLMLKTLNLNLDEQIKISDLRFLTLKPTMYIANINETKRIFIFLNQIYDIAEKEHSPVIPISANLELDLIKMNEIEQKSFMNIFNIKSLALNNIIKEGYNLLNLITFFTVGIKEVRAWPILNGSTSIQAAHKIHSDFSKGFIRVQIIKYNDFIKYRNELKIKEIGKFRIEGKNYHIKDGDIVNFLFNV